MNNAVTLALAEYLGACDAGEAWLRSLPDNVGVAATWGACCRVEWMSWAVCKLRLMLAPGGVTHADVVLAAAAATEAALEAHGLLDGPEIVPWLAVARAAAAGDDSARRKSFSLGHNRAPATALPMHPAVASLVSLMQLAALPAHYTSDYIANKHCAYMERARASVPRASPGDDPFERGASAVRATVDVARVVASAAACARCLRIVTGADPSLTAPASG